MMTGIYEQMKDICIRMLAAKQNKQNN